MSRSQITRAYVGAIVVVGAAVVATSVLTPLNGSLATMALLGAASVLTELLQVPSDDESFDPVDSHIVSFSSGVHLAAILLLGASLAGPVAVIGVIVVDGLRGVASKFIAFNAATYALATYLAGFVFTQAGGTPGSLELPAEFAAIAAMAGTYFLVNTGLVAGAIALDSGVSPVTYFLEAMRRERYAKAAEMGIAVSVAALSLAQPWALIALVPLGLGVYQAYAHLAQLRRQTARALETFANVVDERDSYTYRHSTRVAEHVAGLASALKLPGTVVGRLRWAGRLHDLGKIAVDPAVINKPGALRDDEWKVVLRHPRLSARLLRPFRFAAEEARAVEYHHERFDGRGYYQLDEASVPLAAHFLIVADSYDAMTTDRPYRAGLTVEEALAEIERNAGGQFHPLVARAFAAYVRGDDPREALSPAESLVLRRGFEHPRRGRQALAVQRFFRNTEVWILGGFVSALVSVGFGTPVAAGFAGGMCLCGLIARHWASTRIGRLTRSLRASVQAADRPDLVFHGICGRLAAEGPLQWAGLVHWSRPELTGAVDLEWGSDHARPTDAALLSWLLRETDTGDDFLRVEGSELGVSGEIAALTLRHGRAQTTVLVLSFVTSVPAHIEQALRAVRPALEASLQGIRLVEPLSPAAAQAS
jgi:HD-GYP domain-containing protein (c-di-GMP phosphodiesterase class II)